MPLPDKVIEQLGREPPKTQGWAFGAILFSGGLLFIVALIYFGLTYGYEPYLSGQVSSTEGSINQLNQSISPADQANLINFYSQTANLSSLINNHVFTSQFFSWLEKNTEANVYYTSFSLAQNGEVTLGAVGASVADVNQQIAIFENDPEVVQLGVSGVSSGQGMPGYSFKVTLDMNPSLFLSSSPAAAPATPPVTSATSTASSSTQ